MIWLDFNVHKLVPMWFCFCVSMDMLAKSCFFFFSFFCNLLPLPYMREMGILFLFKSMVFVVKDGVLSTFFCSSFMYI